MQETYGSDPSVAPGSSQAGLESGIAGEEAGITDLMKTRWEPVSEEPKFGLLPLIIGSLKVSLIAVLLAAPLAIFAALYTSTIAPRWAKEIMKPTIEILAGFPSVVIGFFALITLATFFQRASVSNTG